MKKNVFILIVVFTALFACLTIQRTLAKYTSEVSGNANLAVADWLVKVNGTDITTKGEENEMKEYAISEITWNDIDASRYEIDVEEGYIAPGKAGSFGITIDATECKVAVDYEVYMNFEAVEEYVREKTGREFDSASSTFRIEGVYLVRTGHSDSLLTKNADGKYVGSILLSDIGTPIKLRADIRWDLGSADPEAVSSIFDSLLGSDTNNSLNVPVTVTVKQKIGP